MAPEERFRKLRNLMRHRSQLVASGTSDTQIARLCSSKVIVRVRRDWYVGSEDARELSPEERHLLQVIAISTPDPPSGVLSHHSAAAAHDLPLFGLREERVHLTSEPGRRIRSTRAVERHSTALDPDAVVELGGLLCTSLERTAVDLARYASPEVAIAVADTVLRRIGYPPPTSTSDCGIYKTNPLLEALAPLPVGRGTARARRIFALADPRAESPLESVSRYYAVSLGYRMEVQVRIQLPNGVRFRPDLKFKDLNLFGEADGKIKYVGTALKDRRNTELALYEEKRRDHQIKNHTGTDLIHWGYPEIQSISHFAQFLTSLGYPPPLPY